MPGYAIHLSATTKTDRSFILGVEAPDILKKWYSLAVKSEKKKNGENVPEPDYKTIGLAAACKKYNSLKTSDMPDFSRLESRISQKEIDGNVSGLHFGLSSSPNIIAFWGSLNEYEKKSPFWRGYLWHLLTDLYIYKKLDIDAKFLEFMEKNNTQDEEKNEALKKEERNRLHREWDMINALVCNEYAPSLPLEVLELDIVKFADREEMRYADWDIIRAALDYLRQFDILAGEPDAIIQEILINC